MNAIEIAVLNVFLAKKCLETTKVKYNRFTSILSNSSYKN